MGVARGLGSQRGKDEQLLWRVGEVVVAADDVGDAHLEVVDRDREVVQRSPIATRDHEVVQGGVRERDRSADEVVDHRLALVGDPKADRRVGSVAGLAAVSGTVVLRLPRANLLAAGGVAVGGARVEQALERGTVGLATLVLGDRAFIPVELEPPERVEDLLDVLGRGPLAVGVLDPQGQRTACSAGGKPVIECGAGAADVKGAGGRRGEAEARRSGHQC